MVTFTQINPIRGQNYLAVLFLRQRGKRPATIDPNPRTDNPIILNIKLRSLERKPVNFWYARWYNLRFGWHATVCRIYLLFNKYAKYCSSYNWTRREWILCLYLNDQDTFHDSTLFSSSLFTTVLFPPQTTQAVLQTRALGCQKAIVTWLILNIVSIRDQNFHSCYLKDAFFVH